MYSAQTEKPFPSNKFGMSTLSLGSGSLGYGSSTDRASGKLGKERRLQPANPFFDNIRQNIELSHGAGHERISLNLPRQTRDRAGDLPTWLSELVNMSDNDSAARLAEEFYRLELGEQKRLQAVMEWHSKQSGIVVDKHKDIEMKRKKPETPNEMAVDPKEDREPEKYFPFSITAGVERGSKNR